MCSYFEAKGNKSGEMGFGLKLLYLLPFFIWDLKETGKAKRPRFWELAAHLC